MLSLSLSFLHRTSRLLPQYVREGAHLKTRHCSRFQLTILPEALTCPRPVSQRSQLRRTMVECCKCLADKSMSPGSACVAHVSICGRAPRFRSHVSGSFVRWGRGGVRDERDWRGARHAFVHGGGCNEKVPFWPWSGSFNWGVSGTATSTGLDHFSALL